MKEDGRMAPPSCLVDGQAPLVADTSALINLNATGCAKDILRAMPRAMLLVEAVVAELEEGRRTGRTDADDAAILLRAGNLQIAHLDDAALIEFGRLVAGSAAESLDDGEAATLAYAAQSGAVAVIDERKAMRICKDTMKTVMLAGTVDLLAHPAVAAALGRARLAEAVHNALRLARMRVFEHHLAWVLDLIGEERALNCPSLPRHARSRVARQ
jgi:predicted nucleic acid-binding protein